MSEQPWTRLRASRPRLTRRAVLQLAVGILLYLAGANAAAGWVVVLSAAVIGVVPWAWASSRRSGRRIEARRFLPPVAVAGVPVDATLEVRAPTGAYAVVRDVLLDAVGSVGDLRREARLETRPTLRRGALRAGEVEVQLSDLFGLVAVTATGQVPVACDVLPAVPQLPGTSWSAPWATQAMGAALRAGHGTEVLGVRDYRHGDPPKVIHWRTTARQGRLMARELATEARSRVRVEIGGGQWSQAALDRAAEAVGALASTAQASGQPVEVGMDGLNLEWGAAARRHLALLPPHVGAAARPLGPPPEGDGDVVVTLRPHPDGAVVELSAGPVQRTLGTLPDSATSEEVSAWLGVRTRRSAG